MGWEDGQSQAEEARWLQVTQKWSPDYEAHLKQVVNSQQSSCRDCPLCPASSLVHPFDYIQQETLNILELKTSVMVTTRTKACAFFRDELKCTRQNDSRRVFTWREM
ncbi:hypothetical protein TNCV_652481 [Trichonephila clavipes]|nr:hypothetical protein TNCV_652481 [Trichonephila clavipes]